MFRLLNRQGERIKLAFRTESEMLNPAIVEALGLEGLSESGCDFVFVAKKDDKPEQVGAKNGITSFWFYADFLVNHNLFDALSKFAECKKIS